MRKFSVILLVIVVVFAVWRIFFRDKSNSNELKQQPLKVAVHSTEFNKSIAAAVSQYLSLKDAFVNADTSKIKAEEKKLITAIDSIRINELKTDTTSIFQSVQAQLSDVKSNADAILQETDITEMRQDFRMVSENLFPFLKTIHYEGEKLYWQNCPMAFGEGKDANWISNTAEIFNPYLGKNHPEFKGTMLHCGEIKDTIQ
jgi:hypothetical protein